MTPTHLGRLPAAVGLALLLGLAVLWGLDPAAAQDREPPREGLTVALIDAPLDPEDPRSSVYIVGHFQPGTRLSRTIEVANGTDDDLPLTLGVADASATGAWTVDAGFGDGDIAQWTTVTPTSLILAPGERRNVGVEIVIPEDAFGGERYAVVIAETDLGGSGAAQFIGRVGVRAYLSVGGPEAPLTDFTIDTLQPLRSAAGLPSVLIQVTNTGERVIDVAGRLDLTEGPGSLSAGPFRVVVPRTLGPGFSGEVLVDLDASLPDGPWLATTDLLGGAERRQAEARITFPAVDADPRPDDDVRLGPNGELLGEPVEAKPLIDRGVLLPVNGLLLLAATLGLLLLLRRK